SLMSGSTLLDINLSNDHPIAFDYTTALATTDGELFDPSTTASGLTTSGTIDTDMLFTTQMECASCHDVHDDTYGNFLIMDNTASALCLTCHNK
ncbi:MAG: cytochrome c3 family protein, partial [Oligoflexia bacterium]|nr:cytochrome c3 family protein [Oligoflexia bacterium]